MLAADMSAFAAHARARLMQVTRDVLAAVAEDLVMNTPVDTGRLRAGWNVATGAFSDATQLEAHGLTHEALELGAQGRDPGGMQTVARLQAFIATIEIGEVVSFNNNVPYAFFVEVGTSKMAPRAFMRGTLARVPAIAAAVEAQDAP